ncbi:MAG: hypothetical protein HY815_31285 [Candidatus Riflebacteria bacterium]|nr:hypothetical protein [Candidatus Riflebacteria bacterium]
MSPVPERALVRVVLGLVVLAAVFAVPLRYWLKVRFQQPVAMRVVGQEDLPAGTRSVFRVLCVDPRDASPLPGADVEVVLTKNGQIVASVRKTSGPRGEVLATFELPSNLQGDVTLTATARSHGLLSGDSDTLSQTIHIARRYKVLLTSDKPFYQRRWPWPRRRWCRWPAPP